MVTPGAGVVTRGAGVVTRGAGVVTRGARGRSRGARGRALRPRVGRSRGKNGRGVVTRAPAPRPFGCSQATVVEVGACSVLVRGPTPRVSVSSVSPSAPAPPKS